MGSSEIIENSITRTMSNDKKKFFKCKLFNIFGHKKGKEKDLKEKEEIKEVKKEVEIKVDDLVKNFRLLGVEKEAEDREDDELRNFCYNTVRTNSNSSQDSGFEDVSKTALTEVIEEKEVDRTEEGNEKAEEKDDERTEENEKDDERTEEVLAALGDLKIDDGKKKKCQLVPLSRGPIRFKPNDLSGGYHPYSVDTQINHTINRQTFSGGQVIVAKAPEFPRHQASYQENDLQTEFSQLQAPYLETELQTEYPQLQASCHETGLQTEFLQIQAPYPENNLQNEFPQLQTSYHEDDLQTFNKELESIGVDLNRQPFDFEIVEKFLDENNTEDQPPTDLHIFVNTEDILKDFLNEPDANKHLNTITNLVDSHIEELNNQNNNPIDELENTNHLNYEKIENLDTLLGLQQEPDVLYTNIFPTPPSAEPVPSPSNDYYTNFLTPTRSDTNPSPMSNSSFYPASSEGGLSPNSDCEKYQEIPPYDEYPNVTEDSNENEKKARERNSSTSSLTMKNFKDMQKELTAPFSKMECCQMKRKPCKEIFAEHLKKLKAEERRSMCVKAASMDLKTIYGVLHHILLGLSREEADEDFHLALFAVLGEQLLGTSPQAYLGDIGLSLLKAAALRCPSRPLLTRYLVHCIRVAAKQHPQLLEGKQVMFKELDSLGDTLVIALARAGDKYAGALAELVASERGDLPLFNVHHTNNDGYTALHVCAREHSASCPRLHAAHVLLEHGHADIWKGDVKGGDTSVHMAVNSPSCDLRLVLLLFKHLDRKEWKKLAHKHNRSSISPLDHARSACKSSSRTNYPQEVLEFLKKCR